MLEGEIILNKNSLLIKNKKTTNVISFVVFCVFFYLAFNQQLSITNDAASYYNISQQFGVVDFPSVYSYISNLSGYIGFRGYFFSFIIFLYDTFFFMLPLQYVFGIMSTSIFALLIVCLCSLLEINFSIKKFLVAYLLTAVLFIELFKMPLSDLYAVAFLVFSLFFAKLSINIQNHNKFLSIACIFVSGFLAYATYNTRTIYLFSIPIIILFIFLYEKKINGLSLFVIKIAVFGFGMIACSVPQIAINYINQGVVNPFVNSALHYGGEDLMVMQLKWGLFSVRYETFLGDASIYPQPQVHFTERLFSSKSSMALEISSVGEYIVFALSNLLTYIVFYFKHMISLFSVFFTKVYLTDLSVSVVPYFLSLNIMFVAIFNSFRNLRNIFNMPYVKRLSTIAITTAVFLPTLAIIPGVAEGRFAIGGYIMFIFYVVFVFKAEDFIRFFKEKNFFSVSSYILFLVIMVLVGLNILSCLQLTDYSVAFKLW